jgi:hypothetical protein
MPSATEELEYAIDSLQAFYKEFKEVSVVESNHGLRIFKKARVSGLPTAVMRRYTEILEYPSGWHFVSEIECDGVYYLHGDGLNHSTWRTAHEKFKMSTVCGHLHSRAGVVYSRNRKKQYFAANFGCLIDPRHRAFDYGKNCLEKPTLGCGVVIEGSEAQFIPLID